MLWVMIHILSWTTKNHQKTLSMPLTSKLKKIQGLFKALHKNLRTFQGKMEFKDFSRTSPKIQGLFKTVQTLINDSCHVKFDEEIETCMFLSLMRSVMDSGKFFTYPSPINSTFCPKWAVRLFEHWVKGRVSGQK